MTDDDFWSAAFLIIFEQATTWAVPNRETRPPDRALSAAVYADAALAERRKWQEKERARLETEYRKMPGVL